MNGEIDVLVFVLFSYGNFRAAGLEVDSDEFTKPVFGNGEGFVQDAGDVVLTRIIGYM